MSRRTIVAALVGAVLVGGLSAPAFAEPVGAPGVEHSTFCLRLEPESGAREGLCVWLPIRP